MINVEMSNEAIEKRLEQMQRDGDLGFRELHIMLSKCLESLKRIEQALNIQDDLK